MRTLTLLLTVFIASTAIARPVFNAQLASGAEVMEAKSNLKKLRNLRRNPILEAINAAFCEALDAVFDEFGGATEPDD